MGVVIRKAINADLDFIMQELELFAKETGTKNNLFGASLEWRIARVSDLINNHFFLIAEKDGVKAGFIAGIISNHFMNPEIVAVTEVFWWVPFEFRGSSVGGRLLRAYTDECKTFANWIVMTIEHHTKIKAESIERLGYKMTEQNFLLEVV